MNLTDNTVDAIIGATRAAGDELMREFGAVDLGARVKPDGSPVLRADLLSSKVLEERLPVATNVPVLSEEHRPTAMPKADAFFIVDPLDGTKEFMKGSRDFAVCVALVEDKQPVLGIIYGPADDELYLAIKGQGAWVIRNGQAKMPIHVSDRVNQRIGITSLSHVSEDDLKLLGEFGCTDTIKRGSALKFCAVASGEADVYARSGRTMVWDTAAGHILINEAGGQMLYYQEKDTPTAAFNFALENPSFVALNRKEIA